MARPRAQGPATLDLLYDAVMTMVDELDEQKAQWQEAERSLIDRMVLRDEHMTAMNERMTVLGKRSHDHANMLGALTMLPQDLDDLKKRVDVLERANRDTDAAPPLDEADG